MRARAKTRVRAKTRARTKAKAKVSGLQIDDTYK